MQPENLFKLNQTQITNVQYAFKLFNKKVKKKHN